MALTQTPDKIAMACLNAHDWKLDIALDSYFSNPEYFHNGQLPHGYGGGGGGHQQRAPKVDKRSLEASYNRYRGKILTFKTKIDIGPYDQYVFVRLNKPDKKT